jgi:hypothetical protein
MHVEDTLQEHGQRQQTPAQEQVGPYSVSMAHFEAPTLTVAER